MFIAFYLYFLNLFNSLQPTALTVSLEVLNVNVPIYDQIRIENEIEIPIQVS